MIVYFKEKSKMLREMLFIMATGAILYFWWLGTHLLIFDTSTIQIIHKTEHQKAQITDQTSLISQKTENSVEGEYLFVASSRGKYFYPKDCSRARSLSIKNMLYFKDKMTAQGQGYVEYSGC